jgi:regulator of protease activity HflC (stomatin/prohibitin superfamily)
MFKMVPQQTAIVVERLGKFKRVLSPGLSFLLPIIDICEYQHSLKEEIYPINNQMAITKDSVTLHLDGVLYLKVVDPVKASYGVSNPVEAMIQMAQTTMRSELGKYTLDQTFEERENLNAAIVKVINEAGHSWGIECMRYEIRDIIPPSNIKKAMELEGEAERQRRATILESEKEKAANINLAQGYMLATILKAEGEAQAVIYKAKSIASSITTISNAFEQRGAKDAIKLKLAENYVTSLKKITENSQAIIVPKGDGAFASMIAQALALVKKTKFESKDSPNKKDSSTTERVVETKEKKVYEDPILESTEEEITK